jgi:hypothetical protein
MKPNRKPQPPNTTGLTSTFSASTASSKISTGYKTSLTRHGGNTRQKDIDLLTATITTNATFDIVRREEEEFTAFVLPEMVGTATLSYTKLTALIFFTDSLPKGEDRQ